MSLSLRALASERVASGARTIVVEVVRARGSVPRDAGTRMLVWEADSAGTIGGGRLEWDAIAAARAALRDPAHWPAEREIVLGASLGQCCGGAVTLGYRWLDRAVVDAWPGNRLPPIQLYGAGHVGRALVQVLATLDASVQWIDERAEAFPPDKSTPSVERVCVEPVEAEVAGAAPGTFYLVLTHRHDLDLRIVAAILQRGDFGFLGLIGSLTKRRRFEQQLLRRGFGAQAIDRITCPIGVAGIDGKEPATIAVAVAAQLLLATAPDFARRPG